MRPAKPLEKECTQDVHMEHGAEAPPSPRPRYIILWSEWVALPSHGVNRKVCAFRRYDGILCTQKQLGVSQGIPQWRGELSARQPVWS